MYQWFIEIDCLSIEISLIDCFNISTRGFNLYMKYMFVNAQINGFIFIFIYLFIFFLNYLKRFW